MSKRRHYADTLQTVHVREQPPLWIGMILGAALVGIAVTATLALMIWMEASGFDSRFAGIENRLAQLSTKIDQAGTRAATATRGPDPNRVYTVRTDGAPFKGRKEAPVTIAEFSDFQ